MRERAGVAPKPKQSVAGLYSFALDQRLPPCRAGPLRIGTKFATPKSMIRLSSITSITLIAILCVIAGTTASKADLIFNFSGEVQTITYNNVSIGAPEPFTQGEPVIAQLQLIGDNLPTTPNSVFTGFVQFGTVRGENTILGVQTASITSSSILTSAVSVRSEPVCSL